MSMPVDILLRVVLTVAAIIVLARLHGLRTFSKMSGFDFAITVSIGSVLAGAITTLGTDLKVYVVALLVLVAFQMILSNARTRLAWFRSALDNPPLLVMENGEMFEENMQRAGITKADLFAKLREANAFDLRTVHAVIVESTGDVSVLHGPADGPKPDDRVMEGVQRRGA